MIVAKILFTCSRLSSICLSAGDGGYCRKHYSRHVWLKIAPDRLFKVHAGNILQIFTRSGACRLLDTKIAGIS